MSERARDPISLPDRSFHLRIDRGGRMTRFQGQAASCAPSGLSVCVDQLRGTASAMALGAALILSPYAAGSAHAGSCTETGGAGSGIWTCTGAAGTDSTQTLTPASGGALTVTTDAAFGIDTGSSYAFVLENAATNTDLTFTSAAGSSIAGQRGIISRNYGTGATTITSNGTIITDDYGIMSYNGSDVTAVTITVTDEIDVSTGQMGVLVRSEGTGSTTITTTGDISADADGISAEHEGTDLIISAKNVTSGNIAINARNDGSGELRITSAGTLTGTGHSAVSAYNSGTNVIIDVKEAVGNQVGIAAYNEGTGSISVTVSESVIATDSAGIIAINESTAADLTIFANDVTGDEYGIFAINNGSGALTITATGAVVDDIPGGDSDGTSGIYAVNSADSGALVISANDVSGTYQGIIARNNSTEAVTITSTGLVTGRMEDAIDVVNSAAGGAVAITAKDVTGAQSAIYADQQGTTPLSVVVSGAVTGGTGYGIDTRAGLGNMTTITVDSGASVSATSGNAIVNDDSDSEVTVNSNATVTGTIALGDGSDELTFEGADFSTVTLFDGGDDEDTPDGFIDVLRFNNTSGALADSTVTNFEQVVIGSGATLTFPENSLTTPELMIESGGTLDGDGSTVTINGNVTNAGLIDLMNGATGDRLITTGNFAGSGGTVSVDVDFATDQADVLEVGGDVTGSNLIAVNNVSSGEATGNDILVVDAMGSTDASNFALVSGPIEVGMLAYDLELKGSQFFLTATELEEPNPNPNPNPNPGYNLSSTGATYAAVPGLLLDGFLRPETLRQRVGERRFNGNTDNENNVSSLWIRMVGDHSEIYSERGKYSADTTFLKAQAGIDFDPYKTSRGDLVFGLFGEYGDLDASVSNAVGTGHVDANGFGFGATATWYGNNGIYVDGVGRAFFIDSDISSSAAGELVDGHSSTAYGLSLETGYRHELDENSSLIPQAQLSWGGLNGGSLTDADNSLVDLRSNDQLVGRLGLAYEYTTDNTDEGLRNAYIIGNILHDFTRSTSVAGNDLGLDGGVDTTQFEIGIGGDWALNKSASLYGEASYRTALGGGSDDRDGYHATLGLSIKW